MLLDVFSRRKRRQLSNIDPLTYDAIDTNTRVRVVHIARSFFDFQSHGVSHLSPYEYWEGLRNMLREELGAFQLPGYESYTDNPEEEVIRYFLNETNVDRIIDCMELLCKSMQVAGRKDHRLAQLAPRLIARINAWLAEAAIGYEYAASEEISDSKFIQISDRASHSEIILPALHLLSAKAFKTADAEFRSALDHLRKRENGDAISEAAKALETLLKIIAAEKQWPHDPDKDTLKKLLEVAIANGPVDALWQSHFNSVRALLESGIATARNRFDSHGQGAAQRNVPDYLARFAVHQSASAILFFAAANGYA